MRVYIQRYRPAPEPPREFYTAQEVADAFCGFLALGLALCILIVGGLVSVAW